ncbi:MAG TPA: YdeI/OmpD-associated family protein [Bacteroidota bacterium]
MGTRIGEPMPNKDPRIDAYIAKSADFAKPILKHIRKAVHTACPEVEETMKWSFPHFDYKGMLCSMAAFKEHCSFGFWKEKLVLGTNPGSKDGMGSFGKITSIADLPSKKVFLSLMKKAVELNDAGVKVVRAKPKAKKPLRVPPYLSAALKKNKKAQATFECFSPSHKREYLEWLTEAKTKDTRTKRLAITVEWLTEGKARNWKYMKK